jgi:ATP-dependent helicase/nuclease subunit A
MTSSPIFTEEQRNAIGLSGTAVALTAAAGSGKTTVLVERYVEAILAGIDPSEILLVTFTNEAADQLKSRISRRLADSISEKTLAAIASTPYIGTLHGFCYRIIDQYGSEVGLPPVESILTAFDWAAHFEEEYDQWRRALPTDQLTALLKRLPIADLKVAARQFLTERRRLERALREAGPEEHALLGELIPAFSLFAERLQRRLGETGAYHFDDLETGALRILESSKAIRDRLNAQFKVIAVDEFQDTSQTQWEILGHLSGPSDPRLFVVGDPKQSIYRFRQADVHVFLSVSEQISTFGGRNEQLSANFRAHPELISAINDLSRPWFDKPDLPFRPMRAGRETTAGQGSFRVARYLSSKSEAIQAEMSLLATLLNEELAKNTAPRDIAILFRAGDRIIDFLEYLRSRKIPVTGKRTEALFTSYATLDIANFLRAVANPKDDLALASFLRSPCVGLSYAKLTELKQSPGETWQQKLRGVAPFAWLVDLLDKGCESTEQALGILSEHSSYFPELDSRVTQLLSALFKETLTVQESVRRINIWEKEGITVGIQDNDGVESAIQLMTVHAAKGLEFEHVYLVDNLRTSPRRSLPFRIERGLPPGIRVRQDGQLKGSTFYEKIGEIQDLEDKEESKRILYVALTRAKETLTIILPEDRTQIPKNSWGELLKETDRMTKV